MVDSDEHPPTGNKDEERVSTSVRVSERALLVLFFILDTTLDFILWWKQTNLAVKPTKRTYFSAELKRAIAAEQDRRCMYCGERKLLKNLQIDHKDPVDRGGGNDRSNLQILCRACNLRKGIHTDAEFRARYRSLMKSAIEGRRPQPPSRVIPQDRFQVVTRETLPPTAVTSHRANKYLTPKQRIVSGSPVVGGVVGAMWFFGVALLLPSHPIVGNIAVFGGLLLFVSIWAGLFVRARYTGRLDD